jgi:hypothetical protein
MRQPDGTWTIDTDVSYTKREAEKLMQVNRLIFGISSQLWPRDEWMKKHNAPTKGEA